VTVNASWRLKKSEQDVALENKKTPPVIEGATINIQSSFFPLSNREALPFSVMPLTPDALGDTDCPPYPLWKDLGEAIPEKLLYCNIYTIVKST
jgi:hypothetical protein